MIITNKLNLDESLVKAISPNRHNEKGCYSATTLLHGVKETILCERHFDEMETDVADNIWQIFGTATHAVMENTQSAGMKEMHLDFQITEKSKLTGRCDCYYPEDKLLVDYKTASCWKVIYKDFEDWNKQGLIYAWLLKKAGYEVQKVKFEALLKDHSKSKAKYDANYPQFPIYVHEYEVTEEALKEIEIFIFEKVYDLEKAETLADDEVQACTEKERWATPTKWAIMKDGRKTALKLCETEKEAEELLQKFGGNYIEKRQGENKKCSEYCPCADFCNFYKNNVKGE